MAEPNLVSSSEQQPAESSVVQAVKTVTQTPPRADVIEDAERRELPVGYLARELSDAEALLSYVSEVGIEIDSSTRDAVLTARALSSTPMSAAVAAGLLAALTQLATQVRPVTAQSLRVSADPRQARLVVRAYTIVAVALCLVLLPFSVATFVSSAISASIRKDTEAANALALSLADEIRLIQTAPPAAPTEAGSAPSGSAPSANVSTSANLSTKDMLKELQQFAVAIRALNSHARQLSLFAPHLTAGPPAKADRDHYLEQEEKNNLFELPVPLVDLQSEAREAVTKIELYQRVRYRAVSAQETAAVWSGAVDTCILPILYAALGACAYLLRLYEEQIRTRTFIADGHRARFLIAGIGGLVIGLFNNFNLTQGSSLSPFALAFLVGYAVDVFFSFLEGLLRTFGRTSGPPAPAVASKKA